MPAGAAAFERLGWAYISKARRTQDAGFYKLAEKTADVMDAQFGVGPDSRLLRGHVLHNIHRFRESEEVARQLVGERGAPADLALLSDALMEQGKLTRAVEVLQRLVEIKPGVEAFSRIAHVRWLNGDLSGAMAAMDSAVRSVSPRAGETQAWMLTRLSGYHLQVGEAERALAHADAAIQHAADYAPALLARGRALLAVGQTGLAVTALERATELNALPEYQWWLADALRATGRDDEAAQVEKSLRVRGEAGDPRTLALFLATRGEDVAFSLRLAREELARRGDAHTYDALAWALAAHGELAAADAAMGAALAQSTRDARIFLHAGEIARRQGVAEVAATHFAAARMAAATLTPSERAFLEARLAGEVRAQTN